MPGADTLALLAFVSANSTHPIVVSLTELDARRQHAAAEVYEAVRALAAARQTLDAVDQEVDEALAALAALVLGTTSCPVPPESCGDGLEVRAATEYNRARERAAREGRGIVTVEDLPQS